MFQTYFNTIQEQYISDNESSELTFRTSLEILLNSFEKTLVQRDLIIKHEPVLQENLGRPDFKVTTNYLLTIGLLETKKIGEDLNKILNSNQIERYKQLSENIIITDYLRFYLLKKGELILNIELFSEKDLINKKFKIDKNRVEELSQLLKLFFESEPEIIYKTTDLAYKLSEKAQILKQFCYIELEKEIDNSNLLHAVFQAFKDSLLPLLDAKYFSDIYAQTLAYSLFLSALNCNNPEIELNIVTAFSLLPNTFPLIKELFHQLDNFPSNIVWAINEIISILKVTDYSAIKKEFSEYRNKEQGFNDPFIFFYEDFLKNYDKTQRELRGVYYTPEPVVSYIVSSIEEILKDTFKIDNGLINEKVTLLDFATGTGTFLLYAFKLAIEEAQKIGDKQTVNKILNEKIIKNFYGFELLVAPYIVAQLKITEFFKEQGYKLNDGNRLSIFLTNTLTNDKYHPIPLMPNLSQESKEANRIKNKDILIILGNPPYAGHSANKGSFIDNYMKDYFLINGERLTEKNPKWLQDDYVKFIRFAQWKMEKVEQGIVGVITNHSYIDNPTFRGMRQSLMNSFDEIYILDLHGNSKKKEKSPDGSKDENIFDIQQGVAIALFIKKNRQEKHCKIYHYDLFGNREAKKDALWQLIKSNTKWEQSNPSSPFYLFKPRSEKYLKKYNKGIDVKSIFKVNGVGITTAHDEFVVDINKSQLLNKFKEFKKSIGNDIILHEKFNVRRKLGWDIIKGWNNLQSIENLEALIEPISYRPFDNRYIFLEDRIVWRAVRKIQSHFTKENIGICIGRQWKTVGSPNYDTFFITEKITDINLFRRGGNVIFPLYTYSDNNHDENNGNGFLFNEDGKKDNFTKEFRRLIKSIYKNKYDPEQILGYIYAVLHSTTFRTKYLEFLKIDFPKIPFTEDEKMFVELSEIGSELIEHHLLRKSYSKNICKMNGTGENFKVEKAEYDNGKVWINKERYFENVPEDIWNFYIGGYQVLDKWLKERKKNDIELSGEDIQHFIKVVNVLDYTIKTMSKIDDLTKDWI